MHSAPPPRPSGTDHHDDRLTPLLEASTEDEVARAIEALLAGDLEKVARDVVRRELSHSPAGVAYIEDVVADVRLRLVRKLASLPGTSGAEGAIQNLSAYVAVVAENACHAFLRVQYPERTRFRNRARYALSHHPDTTLTPDAGGVWRCQCRRVRTAPTAGATQALLDDPAGWLSRQRIDLSQPLPALLVAIVTRCDRPVEFDRLVDALAVVLGIVDVPPRDRRDDTAPAREAVDPGLNISGVLELRQSLAGVWREIEQLPVRQRAALLLNLRGPEGGAVLHLLPGTGVVAMSGLASALELTDTELAALWNQLPLDDLSIAAQLGLSRQQVINLRKAARARLARRVQGMK
jgi:DNA-directed RNA polymerase specialized sigma24 family protein